jgi:hypothetical protein
MISGSIRLAFHDRIHRTHPFRRDKYYIILVKETLADQQVHHRVLTGLEVDDPHVEGRHHSGEIRLADKPGAGDLRS